MSFIQLLKLFIIFTLISYSYEFNLRRRVRETDVKQEAQNLVDKTMQDEKRTEDEIEQFEDKLKESIKEVTTKIMKAAEKIATVGVKDITTASQWTSIQSEIRKGINLISDAYRKFIDIHRQSCESIEDFAKAMIKKYEDELSAVDKMTLPDLNDSDDDTSKASEHAKFLAKLRHMLKYAEYKRQVLPTESDCISDLAARQIQHQANIMRQPDTTQTIVVHVNPPQVVTQYVVPGDTQYIPDSSIRIPCGGMDQYNGHQTCAMATANAAQTYAQAACVCTIEG